MKLKKKHTFTVLCFLAGFFIIHPLSMVSGYLMHTAETSVQIDFKILTDIFVESFYPNMLLWGVLYGVFCGLLGYFFEILKTQKELLKNANDIKDKFLSIVAHDLKAPFYMVIGYASLLLNQYDEFDDEKRKKIIGDIEKSAEQTYQFLENLLEWSRIQSSDVIYEPHRINIHDLLHEVILLYKENADKKEISIHSMVKNDSWIIADLNMISLIFKNLLSNAIKFTDTGGNITISSSTIGNIEKIAITDSGIGMTKKELAKLFRIDTKITKPGTRQEKGTGLGLILCKEFVKIHKGKLDVTSQVGEGSQFIVCLPRH